ncbi:hypothetical protein THPR109532_09030 [Thalassospira profundimaris]
MEDRVTDQEGKYRIYGKPIIYGRFARKCPAGRQGVPGIAPRAAKSKMPSDAFLVVAVEMVVNLARQGGTDAIDGLKIGEPGIGHTARGAEMVEQCLFACTADTGD